jgi:hypothetical protein
MTRINFGFLKNTNRKEIVDLSELKIGTNKNNNLNL